MYVNEIATKNDLAEFLKQFQIVFQNTSSSRWPMRMKKKLAAEYMNTSINQIDNWVNNGDLLPRHDKNPDLHPTTPAYFNKEDLDKLRFR